VAVNRVLSPSGTKVESGETVIVAIGTVVTVTTALPAFPSLVAVIVALPTATPVTMPTESPWAATVATATSDDAQLMGRCRRPPSASKATAAKGVVPPIVTVAVAGRTTTLATGASGVVDSLQASPTTPTATAARLSVKNAPATLRTDM
jgi:hypothetical protein